MNRKRREREELFARSCDLSAPPAPRLPASIIHISFRSGLSFRDATRPRNFEYSKVLPIFEGF